MYEYIITAFKVLVGLITNERLALAACVALGIMLLWIIFSLMFSYQARFKGRVRKINDYISRNGFSKNSREELRPIVGKMPSEFQRGYKSFEREDTTMPSNHIKRFESLDLDLMGGVFNQNKSVLKTYINFIFVALMVLSLSIVSQEDALTAYQLAESAIIPLSFVFVAKIFYYVYTAIRQHQYHASIDEFNEMLDNMDKWVEDSNNLKNGEEVQYKEEVYAMPQIEEVVNEPLKQNNYIPVSEAVTEGYNYQNKENSGFEELQNEIEASTETEEELSDEEIDSILEKVLAEENDIPEEYLVSEVVDEKNEYIPEVDTLSEENYATEEDKEIQETEDTYYENVEDNNQELLVDDKISEERQIQEKMEEPTEFVENIEETNDVEFQDQEIEEKDLNMNYKDNFEPNISEFMDDEEPKRRRGRPRKEVSEDGEFVIKNEKEFEDALVRAEKLMKKNEEPLSASQTKRIEKQIKELVDAMNKYKEGV